VAASGGRVSGFKGFFYEPLEKQAVLANLKLNWVSGFVLANPELNWVSGFVLANPELKMLGLKIGLRCGVLSRMFR
jgi:hypothetical protein